jgi:hypothetical protein
MFKVGQKVVCINNKPISNNFYNSCLAKLKVNEIYTVIGTESTGLQLKEVKSNHPLGGFDKSRFRPIDNDWVEELLCKLMSEVEADELVSV